MSMLVLVSLALSLATTPGTPGDRPADGGHGYRRNVAVLVFDGVELLDFTGPIEAFTEANNLDAAFDVFTVGPSREPVRTKSGTTIVPDRAAKDCPRIDILVIPGGEIRFLLGRSPLARLVLERSPATEITYSVCNGAFALAEAGFLDGLEATTHWTAIRWLREAAPKATVHADRRVVDNGHIVTAAGISAGIDGALHLVDRLLGRANALRTARRMEYTWTPIAPEVVATDAIAQARQAWYASDWAAAAALYEPIVASKPDDATARGRLGVCRSLLRDLAAARPLLERAQQEQPQFALWPQMLGFVATREGRHADAVALLTRAHELDPGSHEIRQFLGLEQFAAGMWRECLPNLLATWRQGRGEQDTLVKIAQAQLALGDRDGALRSLEESADHEPKMLFEALSDTRFDSLRDDPRFTKVRERAAAAKE